MAKVRMQGREYDLDDLTLNELEEIEKRCDAPMEDVDFSLGKNLKVLAHVLLRRDNPKLTAEKAGQMTLRELVGGDVRPPARSSRRTTTAKARPKAKP